MINEINLKGGAFTTIKVDKQGHLSVLTHKDTVVNISDKTLFIKGPNGAQNISRNGNTINIGGPGVVAVNNGNLFQCNSFVGSVGRGSGTSISFSGIRNMTNANNMVIMNGGNDSTTKEACNTIHQIKCDYSHIRRIISNGSMETTIEIPLDTILCDISHEGNGGIHMTNNEKTLTRIKLSLIGNGDISLSASEIGTLMCSLSGNGDISLHDCKLIDNATLKLSGSGDIELSCVMIETALCTISGSGDITGFTVKGDANLAINGAGDIKCNATMNALIKKKVTGCGSVKVKRLSQK